MAHLVRNEQIKLFAGLCNGLAVAFVTAGILTPAAIVIYETGPQRASFSSFGIFAICIALALFIHLGGQALLEFLKEADDD